jgi:phosphatidylserine decarboxylase
MEKWQLVMDKLTLLLESRGDLRMALEKSLKNAGYDDVQTLRDYYQFLEKHLTEIPTQRTMSPDATKFHYLINRSPDNILKKDEAFLEWLTEFSLAFGSFLDTTASAADLQTFINDPTYNIGDYDPGPSGWLTFNQFFAHQLKPGKRPVHGMCDDDVIVSAADSIYRGSWVIDENSFITAKGVEYPIRQLLAGSPYCNEFDGGVFTHSYLDTNDYHRYHTPVRGTIRDIRKIPGSVAVEAVRKKDGSVETTDETGFQFTQTRGLIIIESPVGFVAVLPIGMGHVSSVNITTVTGSSLYKGQEFGYFAYGGSDMVTLFQRGRIEFTAEAGTHYKQGQQIARRIG